MVLASVRGAWQRLENLLLSSHENMSLGDMLLSPATDEEIWRLENEVGISLPMEYKDSLKVHAGTVYWLWLWDSVSLSAPAVVKEDWVSLCAYPTEERLPMSAPEGVKSERFHPRWIPIALNNELPICLDLAPEPGGHYGQIIMVDWEDGTITLLANGFEHWLTMGLDKMTTELSKSMWSMG